MEYFSSMDKLCDSQLLHSFIFAINGISQNRSVRDKSIIQLQLNQVDMLSFLVIYKNMKISQETYFNFHGFYKLA